MIEKVYKIDPEGRYVIIINNKDKERMEDLSAFQRNLSEWWLSDKPFIIFAPYGDIEIKFEKVGEDK